MKTEEPKKTEKVEETEFCTFCNSDRPLGHTSTCPDCGGVRHQIEKRVVCACCGKVSKGGKR